MDRTDPRYAYEEARKFKEIENRERFSVPEDKEAKEEKMNDNVAKNFSIAYGAIKCPQCGSSLIYERCIDEEFKLEILENNATYVLKNRCDGWSSIRCSKDDSHLITEEIEEAAINLAETSRNIWGRKPERISKIKEDRNV